jgi:hypothetical protein
LLAGTVNDSDIDDLLVRKSRKWLMETAAKQQTESSRVSALPHGRRLQQEAETYQAQDTQRGNRAQCAFQVGVVLLYSVGVNHSDSRG